MRLAIVVLLALCLAACAATDGAPAEAAGDRAARVKAMM